MTDILLRNKTKKEIHLTVTVNWSHIAYILKKEEKDKQILKSL